MILAIDPGTTESAFVLYGGGLILSKGKVPNEQIFEVLEEAPQFATNEPIDLAIEMIASYGMAVGQEVFETCVWIGKMLGFAITMEGYGRLLRIKRKSICSFLCGSAKAKDANIRQALIDRFPATGGGSIPQVGTKAKPGPLYGVSADIWSALAVAVACSENAEGIMEG